MEKREDELVWMQRRKEVERHVSKRLKKCSKGGESGAVMGIKRFGHETKVKARSERRYLQTASQLCTKQVGTGEINQTIESLLKVKVQRITKTY